MNKYEQINASNMYCWTLEDKPTVVTDILILMAHVFLSHLPDRDWFLQIKKNQFMNVCKIHKYIGNAVVSYISIYFLFIYPFIYIFISNLFIVDNFKWLMNWWLDDDDELFL